MTQDRKEDATTRGSYTPVDDLQPKPKRHPSTWRRLIQISPMIGLLLGGVALMLLHHIFYSYLNEKSIDPAAAELPSTMRNQNNVNLVGTTIAHGARIMLSMTLSATFAQLFWETLRLRSHSITQIDALVNCGHSPFNPSALRAATISLALFFVSFIASATSVIVLLSPGSLTIVSNFQRDRPCAIPSVSQDVMMSDYIFDGGPDSLAASVLSSISSINSYIAPFQESRTVLCGDGISACSYNVTFIGPALDCEDITNQTDLTSFLNPNPDDIFSATQSLTIWNATLNRGDAVGLIILSRDVMKGLLQATNCTTYNSTYLVGVNLLESTATVRVWDVVRNSILFRGNSFMSTYSESGLNLLLGTIYTGPSAPITDNLQPEDTSFFVTTPAGNHTFSDSVPHFASSLVQNITISLLSGNINYGFSNSSATNFRYINSTCSSSVSVYKYNPTRLLSTYGVVFGVTMVAVLQGCSLILRNGVEEIFKFSDVIILALNEEMFRVRGNILENGLTMAHLIRTDHHSQRLVPTPPDEEYVSKSPTSPITLKGHVQRSLSLALSRLSSAYVKMALLVLATVGCMTLNHAYFHHLDGKASSPSLRLSGPPQWVLNQTTVSIAGIALAYTGQTFVATAIVYACVQVSWRAIRHRGHCISQIDALTRVQSNPFSLSIFHALRASIVVPLLAFLASSAPLMSMFAPGSIKVVQNHDHPEECTIFTPRNMSQLAVDTTLGDYMMLMSTVMTLGSYLPPIDACGEGPTTSRCSYDLQFVGPGFDCHDVTASSNFTRFATAGEDGSGTTLFKATTFNDEAMRLSVQTWDLSSSVYQAVNCTGVLHEYSIHISHATVSTIDVTESKTTSVVHPSQSQPTSFAESYLSYMMLLLAASDAWSSDGITMSNFGTTPPSPGGIYFIQLDGDITFSRNLTHALEDFAQNATLSIFSGQVSTLNLDNPDILENTTTTCTYTFPAYEYEPCRLFLTYGIAVSVTILCAIWGLLAIRWNGVEESMDFSRVLRAVLNEKMYKSTNTLDKDSVIKADDSPGGALALCDLHHDY